MNHSVDVCPLDSDSSEDTVDDLALKTSDHTGNLTVCSQAMSNNYDSDVCPLFDSEPSYSETKEFRVQASALRTKTHLQCSDQNKDTDDSLGVYPLIHSSSCDDTRIST